MNLSGVFFNWLFLANIPAVYIDSVLPWRFLNNRHHYSMTGHSIRTYPNV